MKMKTLWSYELRNDEARREWEEQAWLRDEQLEVFEGDVLEMER